MRFEVLGLRARHEADKVSPFLTSGTLIGWPRPLTLSGRGFPLSRLESRLRCPMCGSRDVVLLITIPRETQTARVAKP